MLCCTAQCQGNWEQFCVSLRPSGKVVLLVRQNTWLRELDLKVSGAGLQRLAVVKEAEHVAWEFIQA